MNSRLFLLYAPLHSYLTLSVRQFALFFYLYFFSQCCYHLFPDTVFLWFPILWLQSLSTTSHSCLILCTCLCYRYFIRWWYPRYTHIHQCYIWQHVIFVFYFLLCLKPSVFSKLLLRTFPDIVSYGIPLIIIYVKLNSKRMFWIPVYIGYFPCSLQFKSFFIFEHLF